MNLINSFTKWFVENIKYLRTALTFDYEDIAKAKETKDPLPDPGANLKNWFRLFGFKTLLLLVGVYVLFEAFKPEKVKRSHHGINKYGERY